MSPDCCAQMFWVSARWPLWVSVAVLGPSVSAGGALLHTAPSAATSVAHYPAEQCWTGLSAPTECDRTCLHGAGVELVCIRLCIKWQISHLSQEVIGGALIIVPYADL